MHRSYKKCISGNRQCTFGQTVITIAAVNVWQCGFYVRQLKSWPYQPHIGNLWAHLAEALLNSTQFHYTVFPEPSTLCHFGPRNSSTATAAGCLVTHCLLENAAQSIINYTPCCTRVPECLSPSSVHIHCLQHLHIGQISTAHFPL